MHFSLRHSNFRLHDDRRTDFHPRKTVLRLRSATVNAEPLLIQKIPVLRYTSSMNVRSRRVGIESIDGKKTKSEFTERFEKLSDDEKCACLIALCESILPKLAGLGGAKFASDVLEKCRQWLESRNVEADYLYSLLESEDDICVFQFLANEKDSEKENVLQCLSTALSYIILLAYRFENQVYLPEPIECVDSETVEYLFCHFQKLCPNSDLLEKLLPSGNKN